MQAMRGNRIFRYNGRWWMQSKEDEAQIGTLTYDARAGLTLDLTFSHSTDKAGTWRSLIESSRQNQQHAALIIHGQAQDGTHFTLYDGFVKSTTNGAGGSDTLCLFFNRGLRGGIVGLPSDLGIDSVLARYYGLEAWLGHNPYNVQWANDSTARVSIEYEEPAPIEVTIDQCRKFVIRWQSKGPAWSIVQKEIRMAAMPFAGIEYSKPVSLDDALTDCTAVSNLFSLLMGAPTSEHDVVFALPDAGEALNDKEYPSALHFMAVHIHPRDTLTQWTPYDVLLSLPRVPDRLEQIVMNWFRLYSSNRWIIAPYFLLQRSPSRYANGRFFDFARVAEAIHRNLKPNEKALPNEESMALQKAIKNAIPESRRGFVMSRLRHLGDLSFCERIIHILNRFPLIAADVVGDGCAQKKFARRVTELRNMEAHLLTTEQSKSDGRIYVKLASKLKPMIDAWLLAELGLLEDEVILAMRDCRQYWYYASNETWPWDEGSKT